MVFDFSTVTTPAKISHKSKPAYTNIRFYRCSSGKSIAECSTVLDSTATKAFSFSADRELFPDSLPVRMFSVRKSKNDFEFPGCNWFTQVESIITLWRFKFKHVIAEFLILLCRLGAEWSRCSLIVFVTLRRIYLFFYLFSYLSTTLLENPIEYIECYVGKNTIWNEFGPDRYT